MPAQRTTSYLTGLLTKEEDVHTTLDKLPSLSPRAYLQSILQQSGNTITSLADKMCASRAFVYQLFEGVRKPGRDMLLRIALVVGLTLEETQRLLTVFERGVLYARVRRDAILMHALVHSHTMHMADESLVTLGERPLIPHPQEKETCHGK